MKSDVNIRIRHRRQELGMTLNDVADRLGVSEATVQRYESGNIKNLKRDTVIKIAAILQTTPTALMGWDDEPEQAYNFYLDSTEARHIKRYRTLDAHGKKNVNLILNNEYTRCQCPSRQSVYIVPDERYSGIKVSEDKRAYTVTQKEDEFE